MLFTHKETFDNNPDGVFLTSTGRRVRVEESPDGEGFDSIDDYRVAKGLLTLTECVALFKSRKEAADTLDRALRAIPVTGVLDYEIVLRATDADQARFSAGLVALSNSEQLSGDPDFGSLTISTLIGPVIDAEGGSHDMTVLQYRQLCDAIAKAIGAIRSSNL